MNSPEKHVPDTSQEATTMGGDCNPPHEMNSKIKNIIEGLEFLDAS